MLRSFTLAAACVLFSLASAEARPTRTASAEPSTGDTVSAIRPVAAAAAEPQQACGRARRRLWLEGEGWVVRKVPTCR